MVDSDTQLNLAAGGSIPADFNAGLGDGTSTDVEINLAGGTVGAGFTANAGSVVNLSGGDVEGFFYINPGATANITGGFVSRLRTNINAAGGSSEVNIRGGSFGTTTIQRDTTATFYGTDFRLNGVPLPSGATVDSGVLDPTEDYVTGVLEDGSPIIINKLLGDTLAPSTVVVTSSAPVDITPIVVSEGVAKGGISRGQTLTVVEGGALDAHFEVLGATLNINGGTVPRSIEAVDSVVNVNAGATLGHDHQALMGSVWNFLGGEIGERFFAHRESTVNISGGELDVLFQSESGSKVNLSGGRVEYAVAGGAWNVTGGELGPNIDVNDTMNIWGGAVRGPINANRNLNIAGGTIGERFDVENGSFVNVSGGRFTEPIDVRPNGSFNLIGSAFQIDGADVSPLAIGETREIDLRDVTLSGVLADGAPFSFDLNSTNNPLPRDRDDADFFSPNATVTITRSSGLPGDYNNDGAVDAADYTVWRDAVVEYDSRRGSGWLINDFVGGQIGVQQHDQWTANFGATAVPPVSGVPEPSSLLLAGLASCRTLVRPRRFLRSSRQSSATDVRVCLAVRRCSPAKSLGVAILWRPDTSPRQNSRAAAHIAPSDITSTKLVWPARSFSTASSWTDAPAAKRSPRSCGAGCV